MTLETRFRQVYEILLAIYRREGVLEASGAPPDLRTASDGLKHLILILRKFITR